MGRSPAVARASVYALAVVTTLGNGLGCAGERESSLQRELARDHIKLFAPAEPLIELKDKATPDHAEANAHLHDYVLLALEHNKTIIAEFERFRASVLRISKARRLPEPIIGIGYFVRPVETRVGPQRARVGIQQAFPWPTKLSAGADMASAQAQALQRRLQAQALGVSEAVARAYWQLWQVRETRTVQRAHLDVVHGLSASVRARLETGTAMLSDLQQIDLSAARVADRIRDLDEAERTTEAQLQAAVGGAADLPLNTADAPGAPAMPALPTADLSALLDRHPLIESAAFLAEAATAMAEAEAADRLPSFTLGADWIITGTARMPGVPDSGQDAVIASAGIRVPLWQGSYNDSVAAAQADARAQQAQRQALLDQAQANLIATLGRLRNSGRQVVLYQETLVPQAEAAYESVLGAYTVGRGSVAEALLAQRDLLELRVELTRAQAEHARMWARLEELVGQTITRGSASFEHDPASELGESQ